MYLNGADDLSFKLEIISGANASMPHGNPSDKPIAAGDALIMDFGLVKNGFWSDMSRTFAVGYATEELQQVYDTVLAAQKRAIDYYATGVNGRELDAVARDYIEASGLEGIYQPGKLGCRIEDILWLGENNEKVNLTHFPKDELIVLGK